MMNKKINTDLNLPTENIIDLYYRILNINYVTLDMKSKKINAELNLLNETIIDLYFTFTE